MDRRGTNSRQAPEQGHQTNGTGNRNGNHEERNDHEASEVDTETAEYYQTFLRRLIAVVSNGEPEAVDRLIAIIRAGASQPEIFRVLSELTATESSSEPVDRTQTR